VTDATDWTAEDAEALRVAVGRFVRAARGRSEIPPAQANVLRVLDRTGPITITELADELKVRHQSARETVAVLSQQNLISTARSADDARRIICTITTAGRARLNADRHARSTWILTRVERLPPAQRRAALSIAGILQVLSENEQAA
jgi:DNA-binding MarR family transcriptional regulator